MNARVTRAVIVVIVGLGVAAGLVALGRATAGTGPARDNGYRAGYAAGHDDGVKAGQADGLREGRELQVPLNLPGDVQAAAKAAYDAGYVAGANDVFDGYDGGWGLNEPYIVELVPGAGGITYRIRARTTVEPGTDYHLCPPSTTLCHEPR
jgi:hypothetical protein